MLLSLGLICVVTLLIYLKRKYFTKYGSIPGKPPHFLFGNIIQTGLIHGRYIGDVARELQAEYGDIFQFWVGPIRVIFICNPEDVQHIFTHRQIYEQGDLELEHHRVFFNDALICNIGYKYKRHASIILPLFRRAKIINNLDIILDCTDKLLNQWRSITNRDYIHENIVEQCQNLSLAIFGFIGFDYDLQVLEEFNGNQSNKLRKALRDFLKAFLLTIPLPSFISKIYLKLSPQHRRTMNIISNHLKQIIEQEQRKTEAEIGERKRTSLIASLVTALQQDEEAEAVKSEQEKKGLSHTEVFHEMLLFLVSGSETTGSALAWLIFFLSKYPHVQAKVKAELHHYKHDRMTVEQIESLTYLNCVIEEVLRFVPIIVGTTRTLMMDDRLPGSDVQLHKGDEIFIPFNTLSRDKRWWKIDPDLFYPERFQDDDQDHHFYASIAFGGGHRQCIGQDLARFELKTIIARLLQYVTFGDGGDKVNRGEYAQKMTVIPKYIGITINFD